MNTIKKINKLKYFKIAEVPTNSINNHWMNILKIDLKIFIKSISS